jgi:flagellar motor switch protein FliM
MLFGGAGQFYQQAQAPIAQTEQDIFNRLNAVAAPERQRQQLAS